MDPMGDGLKFLAQFIFVASQFDLQPMLIHLPRGPMSHILGEAWSNRSMDDSEKDRKGRRLQNGSGSQEKVQIFSGVFAMMGFRKNP